MQVFALPAVVTALIFDVDMTLYDNREYYASQSALLVKRLAEELGEPEEEMSRRVAEVRADFASRNEGRSLSLGNAFLEFDITITQNARWREELFAPEAYLQPDPMLAETLAALASRFELGIVTNNPTSVAVRTLRALGVERFFPVEAIVGLDVSLASKPTMVPFRMAAERLGVPLSQAVSIGDRWAVDVELPVAHGMGGILVEGMANVYALPGVLLGEQLSACGER